MRASKKLRAMEKGGKDSDALKVVIRGTGHAFMGPHNALGTLNETLALQIWPEAMSFLRTKLS